MPRIWTKIDDVIDTFDNSDVLELKHGDVTIFSNSEVQGLLANLYDSFSFRHRNTETPADAFTNQYKLYQNGIGENYFRMYDALTRLYNPINNYSMVESGVDGYKASNKNNNHDNSYYEGDLQANVSVVDDPYEKKTEKTTEGITKTTNNGTDTETATPVNKTTTKDTTGTTSVSKAGSETVTEGGSTVNNKYVNAFDSGISDEGTHAEKNVNAYDNRTTSTSFNDRTDTTVYGDDNNPLKEVTTEDYDGSAVTSTENENTTTVEYGADGSPLKETVVESITDAITKRTEYEDLTGKSINFNGSAVTASNFHTAKEGATSDKNVEAWDNDVELVYSKDNPDGTFSQETLGDDFSNGTQHLLTRSGNIGVTTSAQMITGELEMRRINLLQEYVKGFVSMFCSLIDFE